MRLYLQIVGQRLGSGIVNTEWYKGTIYKKEFTSSAMVTVSGF